LVLDEPTAHLDAATAEALAAELMTITAGRTALIVTHRPDQTPDLPQVRLGTANVLRRGVVRPTRPVAWASGDTAAARRS
jgi:ABC-type transport system involved in cytochrome bd biosynthesis fused ATPase/permease subunit